MGVVWFFFVGAGVGAIVTLWVGDNVGGLEGAGDVVAFPESGVVGAGEIVTLPPSAGVVAGDIVVTLSKLTSTLEATTLLVFAETKTAKSNCNVNKHIQTRFRGWNCGVFLRNAQMVIFLGTNRANCRQVIQQIFDSLEKGCSVS